MTYDMRTGREHITSKAHARASLQRARQEYREARTDMRAVAEGWKTGRRVLEICQRQARATRSWTFLVMRVRGV